MRKITGLQVNILMPVAENRRGHRRSQNSPPAEAGGDNISSDIFGVKR